MPSLALIQCHLVVPIYVLQCNVPLIQEQSRLLSATAEHSYSKIPPLIVLPANKRCPSTVLCIQRERLDQLLNCMCPSHIHYPSPYPCEHIHIHNISIHIHEPCPDFRPQDQVPPNNPIGIQGEAGKETLSKCTLLIDFLKICKNLIKLIERKILCDSCVANKPAGWNPV